MRRRFAYYVSEKLKIGGFYTYLGSDLGTFVSVGPADPEAELGTWDYFDTELGMTVTNLYERPREWTGGRLPQQPEHKMALTVSYDTELSAIPGALNFSGWINYTGERYPNVQNIESQIMRAYSRTDLRATWTSPDEKLSVTGFVQNVFDEIGLVAYVPQFSTTNPLYPPMGTLTDPRRIGVVVNWAM